MFLNSPIAASSGVIACRVVPTARNPLFALQISRPVFHGRHLAPNTRAISEVDAPEEVIASSALSCSADQGFEVPIPAIAQVAPARAPSEQIAGLARQGLFGEGPPRSCVAMFRPRSFSATSRLQLSSTSPAGSPTHHL